MSESPGLPPLSGISPQLGCHRLRVTEERDFRPGPVLGCWGFPRQGDRLAGSSTASPAAVTGSGISRQGRGKQVFLRISESSLAFQKELWISVSQRHFPRCDTGIHRLAKFPRSPASGIFPPGLLGSGIFLRRGRGKAGFSPARWGRGKQVLLRISESSLLSKKLWIIRGRSHRIVPASGIVPPGSPESGFQGQPRCCGTGFTDLQNSPSLGSGIPVGVTAKVTGRRNFPRRGRGKRVFPSPNSREAGFSPNFRVFPSLSKKLCIVPHGWQGFLDLWTRSAGKEQISKR